MFLRKLVVMVLPLVMVALLCLLALLGYGMIFVGLPLYLIHGAKIRAEEA